jgi:hypothetical protein
MEQEWRGKQGQEELVQVGQVHLPLDLALLEQLEMHLDALVTQGLPDPPLELIESSHEVRAKYL